MDFLNELSNLVSKAGPLMLIGFGFVLGVAWSEKQRRAGRVRLAEEAASTYEQQEAEKVGPEGNHPWRRRPPLRVVDTADLPRFMLDFHEGKPWLVSLDGGNTFSIIQVDPNARLRLVVADAKPSYVLTTVEERERPAPTRIPSAGRSMKA